MPVSQAVRFDFGLAVGPMVPASVKNLADYVAWCKANPKDANFGSPAAGSVPHFVAELFGRAAGIADYKHVPYRGTQPAIVDLMGGQARAVIGTGGRVPAAPAHRQGAAAGHFRRGAQQVRAECAHLRRAGLQGHRVRRVVRHLPAGKDAGRGRQQAVRRRCAQPCRRPTSSMRWVRWGSRPNRPLPPSWPRSSKRDSDRWAPLIKTIGFSADS